MKPDLIDEARGLLDRAAAEGRDLTAEEEARFDEILAAETRDRRTNDTFDPRSLRARTDRQGVEARAGAWLAGELRSLAEGSGPGAAFSPTEFASTFFDLLAPESQLLRAGIRVIRTDREELKVPHLKADPAVGFFAEGATITAADPDADVITATPRKLAGRVELTNELIADSDPAILNVLASQLIRAIANAWDVQALEGSGMPPAIRGLANVSGIQTVSMGTNGAAPTNLDPFADAIGLLAQENAEPRAIFMHARTWGTLAKLKELPSGSNKPLLQESAGSGSQGLERRLYGLPVYLVASSITETQGTSSDASSAYVVDTTEVVAVMRQDARVELDSSRLFDKDSSEVRVTHRADLVVPNPKAVVRILGLRP